VAKKNVETTPSISATIRMIPAIFIYGGFSYTSTRRRLLIIKPIQIELFTFLHHKEYPRLSVVKVTQIFSRKGATFQAGLTL
jgi:hypothetical protein